MFLAGLKFGFGFLIGMSGVVVIGVALVALAEWFRNWWKVKRARQGRAEQAKLRKELVNQARFVTARRTKALILWRSPRDAEERAESSGPRIVYIR
ncbi:hypothetical protein [Terracidiphilus sp.]|jgi:hypothetical protein|uniref:hypothetical protein n=1 Tax=Terracidiphilus sp. TaxID=1964191 RepID=UPI003C1305EE